MIGRKLRRAAAKRRTATTFMAAVVALSPYTYWRFAEASGTAVADVMGRKNATLGGTYTRGVASLLPSMSDSAVDMGTSTGYATIPNTGQFLFNGWSYYSVLRMRTFSTSPVIFHVGDYTVSSNQGIAAHIDGNGKLMLQWFNGGWLNAYSTFVFSANTTYHVCLVFLTATSMALYVNGAYVETLTLSAPVVVSAYPMVIGAVKAQSPDLYHNRNDGIRDDFFVMNRILTAQEIATLYASR